LIFGLIVLIGKTFPLQGKILGSNPSRSTSSIVA